MDLATYQSETLAPGWLRSLVGSEWLKAFGAAKDEEVVRLKQAVKCRLPTICPADALGLLGRERMLDRGPGEDETHYRERLWAAWSLWQWAGTPYGMLLAFYWAGYRPNSGAVVLQTQSGLQHVLRGDFDPNVHAPEESVVTTNIAPVHLGGAPVELWSDFAVLFANPLPTGWAPTFPADASPEVEHIRRLIVAWKPGHCRCVKLQASGNELWDYPADELWEPTTEPWDETPNSIAWTPPIG